MRPAWLRSPEADTLLLECLHVLRGNLGLHRPAGRRLGPFKLGVARRLPGPHLLGFDEPLADLAQPLVVAATALVELGDDGAEGAVRPPAEANVVGGAPDLLTGDDDVGAVLAFVPLISRERIAGHLICGQKRLKAVGLECFDECILIVEAGVDAAVLAHATAPSPCGCQSRHSATSALKLLWSQSSFEIRNTGWALPITSGAIPACMPILRITASAKPDTVASFSRKLNHLGSSVPYSVFRMRLLSRICGVILVPGAVPSCDKGQFP